jgi:hypothetical protein
MCVCRMRRAVVQYDKSGVAKPGSSSRSKSSVHGHGATMDPLAFSVLVDIDRTDDLWMVRDGPLMPEEEALAYVVQ